MDYKQSQANTHTVRRHLRSALVREGEKKKKKSPISHGFERENMESGRRRKKNIMKVGKLWGRERN